MGRSLPLLLPRDGGLLRRLRRVLAGVTVASAGLATTTAAVSSQAPEIAPPPLAPEIVNAYRSKLPMRGMFRLPRLARGLAHGSHVSHASHSSGSTGRVRAPVAEPPPVTTPAPAPAPMPLVSTPRPAPSAGTAMRVTDMPPVDGIIESIDLKAGSLTIKDLTPLEATIEFFFAANATFTPLAGQPVRINPNGRLPFTVGETVQIEWTRTPATGAKKVIVSILERP